MLIARFMDQNADWELGSTVVAKVDWGFIVAVPAGRSPQKLSPMPRTKAAAISKIRNPARNSVRTGRGAGIGTSFNGGSLSAGGFGQARAASRTQSSMLSNWRDCSG